MRIVADGKDELVVWKPAGLPAELSDDRAGVSLLSRLRVEVGPEVRLCHRLDRPTQGFVVVAKSKEAAAWHGARLAAREWRKWYVARVVGAAPLGRHKLFLRERSRRVEVVRSGGQVAWLDVLEQRGEYVLVELLTGRRHQVRVMLAELGAPLRGDPLYGGAPGPFFLEHARLEFPTRTEGRRVLVDEEVPAFGAVLAAI